MKRFLSIIPALIAVLLVTFFNPGGVTVTPTGGFLVSPQVAYAQPAPNYTEDMDFWVTDYGSDDTWEDYDIFTNHGVPKGAVAEIIIVNQEAGDEAQLGIRTDGSGLNRYVWIHEAEQGGVTTCRMFVLVDDSTGLVETWADDVSDENIFYIVGYWENVGFTERWDDETPDSSGGWDEEALVDSGAASKVCHMLLRNQEQDIDNTVGVRATDSVVDRYIYICEPDTGGENVFDMMVKADASYKIDLYTSDNANTAITNSGYFGSEMDFVELFQLIDHTVSGTWEAQDLTAYLDEDGRVCDFLLAHHYESAEMTLGVRDGDDSTTNRYILEHEAEQEGNYAVTGFGISAKSNASGVVNSYSSTSSMEDFYLMGYFKPVAVGAPNISNTPDGKGFGTVNETSSYWSNDSAPTFPLDDGECNFTITNNSGAAVDISIVATNFTGGDGWVLVSGSPGSSEVRLRVGKSGDANEDAMVILTTSGQSFITSLADTASIKWEVKLETGTFTDGVLKESVITLTATLS